MTVVVAVAHAALEHVRYRLEAAMRMVGEAGDVILGPVGAELIEQQESINLAEHQLADDANETYAGAVRGWQAADAPLHGADTVVVVRGAQ